ncbi:MAG: DNA repair protein RadC [Atribacterota bacterium]|nr:DNA repair protein RadC [Atribacterota bacterium]MDD3031724.1 DNA repair protein RadC [Atribacterota bacterium]MDD3641734.1 DNA repair protein RadC [Atribacterota bacterium]MDD4288623.1 DNA repair protein RadC [Atribacterota bacterium]MDD4765348.1 DNA repair protein RadC [Atribacterota bacterium]
MNKEESKAVKNNYTIKDWPESERPRERLMQHGAEYLTDAELLAIILVNGYSGKTSVELARSLLTEFGGLRKLMNMSYAETKKIPGIGRAKYSQIKAVLELARRLSQEKMFPGKRIQKAQDVVDYYYAEMRDKKKELFHILLLDIRYQVIRDVLISMGSLTETTVHPREVLKEVIKESAAAVIFLHNHPSGNPNPSSQDIKLTDRLCKSCQMIGVKVLDHIIIGEDNFYSFTQMGQIS